MRDTERRSEIKKLRPEPSKRFMSVEKDPDKLMELVREINRPLDEKRKRLDRHPALPDFPTRLYPLLPASWPRSDCNQDPSLASA